jgi:hypothetical protein
MAPGPLQDHVDNLEARLRRAGVILAALKLLVRGEADYKPQIRELELAIGIDFMPEEPDSKKEQESYE